MSFVLEIRTKTTARQKKSGLYLSPSPFLWGSIFFGKSLHLFWVDPNLWANRFDVCFPVQRKKKQVDKLYIIPEKASAADFFQPPPQKKKGNEKTYLSFDHQEKHLDSLQSLTVPSLLPSVSLLGYHSPSIIQIVGPGDWDERFDVNFVEPISPVVLPGHTLVNGGKSSIELDWYP